MKMKLTYQGNELPANMVSRLIAEAEKLNVPPSYLIVKLHYEGLWGKSEVARANNNWSGMTWSDSMANGRPSGVKVTRGSARPANEGGYYVKYASVDDFFKDWLYLIRRGGIYQVADSATFGEAVKGMFRCGGAKYDYATMNINGDSMAVSHQRYEAYLKGMKARRTAINNENKGYLDQLDKKGDDNVATVRQVLDVARSQLGVVKYSTGHKRIIDEYNAVKPLPVGYKVTYDDDWCDTFVSWVAIKAKATHLIDRECGVERHKNIFKRMGIWQGMIKPKPGDIVIFRWDGNRNGWAHHIGFVEVVNGNTITTIEGNTVQGGKSLVGRNKFKWNDQRIQGYARPLYGADIETVAKGTKTESQIVDEVIKGNWGNGDERKRRLKSAGYNYDRIQELINQKLTGRKSNEEIADEVLAGKHGNNPERIDNLVKLGYDPNEIQEIVNKKLATNGAKETVKPKETQQVGGDEVKLAENEYMDYQGRIWVVTQK